MNSVIRPWICAIVTVTACWIAGWTTYKTGNVPEWFIAAFVSMVTFYFTARSYEKMNGHSPLPNGK